MSYIVIVMSFQTIYSINYGAVKKQRKQKANTMKNKEHC